MITYLRGDILQSDAEALVNTVNCVGVMGRGIALQFKDSYPENFTKYAEACQRGEVRPGSMLTIDTGQLWPRYIINFPTKRHWRGKSRIEDIESGLSALVQEIRIRNIHSIAIPPLGSGLGGLDWRDVRPIIERSMEKLTNVDVRIYEPGIVSPQPVGQGRQFHGMTEARAALVGLMDLYLGALLDPTITLLEVHKLMYFLQASGEALQLRFAKAPHGPYAENLHHVLEAVEGQLISGYESGRNSPSSQLTLVATAMDQARPFLEAHKQTRDHIHRVGRLVEGYETPFGLELLATVHWLTTREQVHSSEETVQAVYAWGTAKRKFTVPQIELAMAHLATEGWSELQA